MNNDVFPMLSEIFSIMKDDEKFFESNPSQKLWKNSFTSEKQLVFCDGSD